MRFSEANSARVKVSFGGWSFLQGFGAFFGGLTTWTPKIYSRLLPGVGPLFLGDLSLFVEGLSERLMVTHLFRRVSKA